MPFAAETFGTLGETTVLEGRSITADNVRGADVLAIRSTTRVNRELLQGSRVRFVGTATIGTDHMDTDYLDSAGIRWCYAPGCNANSVSEYVTAALLHLAQRYGWVLQDKTIGIIGVGNVGRRVAEKAEALGLRVLLNDPPRERAGDKADFQPLERLLAEADILTLHVPLNNSGPDATRQMVNDRFFAGARRGLVFINSARGAVVNTMSLLKALEKGLVAHAVIDTWKDEPQISRQLLERVEIGTPHIAGYSYDGKVAGTVMVYQQACRFLNRTPLWDPTPFLPPSPVPHLDLRAETGAGSQDIAERAVRAVYEIARDDQDLRRACKGNETAAARNFDKLRRCYRQRREFRFTRVSLPPEAVAAKNILNKLGFQTEE